MCCTERCDESWLVASMTFADKQIRRDSVSKALQRTDISAQSAQRLRGLQYRLEQSHVVPSNTCSSNSSEAVLIVSTWSTWSSHVLEFDLANVKLKQGANSCVAYRLHIDIKQCKV